MIPKFRAWDKRENTMRDVAVLHFTKGGKVNSIEYWKTPSELKSYHVRNLILMQSTGLKDKNGVEIFEGDFCIQRGEELYSDENMTLDEDWEYRGVIKFQDFAYWIQDNDGFVKWMGTDCDEIEVIGNVWEDGDLINDGKRTKEN